MEQELILISDIITKEEKEVLMAMIEESLNSMLPDGYEFIDFDDIKDDVYYEDYKKAQRIWVIQEEIKKKLER